MSTPSNSLSENTGDNRPHNGYGGYTDIVDYILGITFEIWEQGKVDRILDYYGADIDVFSLEGLTHGAARMVEQTHATLEAFPDRLLLGEDVIWCGDLSRGFSSHRIRSPMTNHGDTAFGPATGRQIVTMNIADCEITQGRITREWLIRDNLALVNQLGFDVREAAYTLLENQDDPFREWLKLEHERVTNCQTSPPMTIGEPEPDPSEAFARQVLKNCWQNGNKTSLESAYAPYCVMHRAPLRIFSGRTAILDHYADWRTAFPDARLSVDHVCSQSFDSPGLHIAARWSIAGHHEGPFGGLDATGKPIYICGVSHWRVLGGRIISEWTVFDELAMLSQALDELG